MSEKHQYRTWILLDKGTLQIKQSIEHPGHGWADLNALLERVGELEAENKMAKALLGDILDGGYGARYGWEDAHDWLRKHSPEYNAQYE